MKDEERVLLATSIAMELAKGLDEKEICELINFVGQISCSLSSLLKEKKTKKSAKFDWFYFYAIATTSTVNFAETSG